MEFRGIIYLNSQTAYQFDEYLSHKESELSFKMIETITAFLKRSNEPILPKLEGTKLKLRDALSFIGKEVRELSLKKDLKFRNESLTDLISRINEANWHYLEILENSESELFSHIKLLGIEAFQVDIEEATHSIKKSLMEHIDDFYWYLKRLNKQLSDLEWFVSDRPLFKYVTSFFFSSIDKSLFSNAKKSKKFLSFNYQKFYESATNYQKLLGPARGKREKLEDCVILNKSIDEISKSSFEKIYELLKIAEINQKLKLISNQDLNDFVKNTTDPKRMSHILEEYQNALLNEVFVKSRLIKSEKILGDEKRAHNLIYELEGGIKEVHLLASTADRYRELLLKSDPDPYVRLSFGFKDFATGKEPSVADNLRNISYDVEEIESFFKDLIEAYSKPSADEVKFSETKEKSVPILHEMAQPLISESTMKRAASNILDLLKQLDELGSSSWKVVDFVGQLLSRLLKYDWKYHILFSLEEFEKAYAIHIGILIHEHNDRMHLNRMDELRRLLKEIKDFLKSQGSYKNKEEFIFLLNDIKGALQDFFGYAQNRLQESLNPKATVTSIRFQLMEYRYLFGRYFYEIKQSEDDLQLIKREFLFVDQYLEAIESTVNSSEEL